MQRRDFIKACAASCALGAGEALAAAELAPRFYTRATLVDGRGEPVRAARLAAGENYIFHYPFQGTPCFLLDLGRPSARAQRLRTEAGPEYLWPGGVGPKGSIVAFSAICAHRMSYPTPQISFISYRSRSTLPGIARSGSIYCCSEHSEYDPASGARVLGGPAREPLCAIVLEYEAASDALAAVGTLGPERFEAFFARFEFRLALDYGAGVARRPVAERTVVKPLHEFCRQQVRC